MQPGTAAATVQGLSRPDRILLHKTKNPQKIENTKKPALNPSFNSTRLSLASCPKSLEPTLGCCLCGFLFFVSFLAFLSRRAQNQKKPKKKPENTKNPVSFHPSTRYSASRHSLGQLSARSRPEIRSSHWLRPRRLSFCYFDCFFGFRSLDGLFLHLHFLANGFRKSPSFPTFDWASDMQMQRAAVWDGCCSR